MSMDFIKAMDKMMFEDDSNTTPKHPDNSDLVGIPIRVGDTIIFPSSGIMEEGVVQSLRGETISILTKSGYKKTKYCSIVINLTALNEMKAKVHPELCI